MVLSSHPLTSAPHASKTKALENAEWRKDKPNTYCKRAALETPTAGPKPNAPPTNKKRRLNTGSQGWSNSIYY
jgi:hypothetical protein